MTQLLFDDPPELPRLFLFDTMALVYRAHFALIRNPIRTSSGFCTSAIYGLTNTLLDIIAQYAPTYYGAAFDTAEPTHRHQQFEEYKAHRQAMPEELSEQLPYVDRLLDALRVPILRVPGYEADDLIGTLSRQAEPAGIDTYMVTPDKDMQQLVSPHTFALKPGRQGGQYEILGVREVLDRWKIARVDQLIDILGLMGDASDNIPGVPGIGEKTAQKLIAEFGSLEELLANTDRVAGKQRERLQEYAAQARLSKQLATIVTDAPHGVTWKDLERRPHDPASLRALLMELEFEALGKRLFGKSFSAAPARAAVLREKREREIQAELFPEVVSVKTIAEVPHRYHIVRTAAERQALIEHLRQQASFCFDTETTGLDPRRAFPLGISFSSRPQEAHYVVCPTDPAEARAVLLEMQTVFTTPDIEKIGHNLKYDLTLLKWHGVEVQGRLFDTMLAHQMKEPEMQHGLDYLAKLYLGYQPISITQLIGERGPDQGRMSDVPLDQLAEYACEDADIGLQVSQAIRPDIERRGVAQVCYDVECPLLPVLVDMEFTGIRLDVEAIQRYSHELAGEIDQLRQAIFQAAGHEFNIDSPRQLGQVLYDELKIEERPKKTATGQYSTREAELVRLAQRHTIVRDVLDYRNAVKLKSVYVDQLPATVNPETGRIHTTYIQTWTATGRMQSANPNLQTIPVRKERGREIRAAFVPRNEDYRILSVDYSQVELRLMAELSDDVGLMQAFQSGTDVHTVTAANLFKVAAADVTRAMRDKAKVVNFGIIYGISAFGLQQRLNISKSEASGLIQDYFQQYPGVKTYIEQTLEFAREHGYVKTLTGRRRYVRDILSKNGSIRQAAERLAMNSPIQGTAADLLKLAMIRVHELLQSASYRTRMLLTVHDEIVFDLHVDERDELVPRIAQAMKTALPTRVPLEVEIGIGDNWLAAH